MFTRPLDKRRLLQRPEIQKMKFLEDGLSSGKRVEQEPATKLAM